MIRLYGDFTPLMKKAAETTWKNMALSGRASVEVLFVDEERIRRINSETRNIDSATDVLSFPLIDEIKPFVKKNYPYEYSSESKSVEIGSIVICVGRAEEQAKEFGHSFERELTYLFVHGLLHILGYDHINEDDKKVMRQKEEEIIGKLNLKRDCR